MFEKFLEKFITNTFIYLLVGTFVIALPFLLYYAWNYNPIIGTGAICVFLFVVAYGTHYELFENTEKQYKQEINNTTQENMTLKNDYEKRLSMSKIKEELLEKTLKERAYGFPSLFTSIAYWEKQKDDQLSNHLIYKQHPAITSAKIVQEEARRRREAEFIQRKTQSIIEYYENIAPFLLDFKEQEIDDTENALRDYTQEETDDPVTNFLTKDEYRKLSSTERNQMALDRFWRRPNKSKWLLGRMYERYVGYLYEKQGFSVEYTGFNGYEDLGRDLICSNGNETIVIQCKNWSKFKTIFEKHIFQFFGTVFQYKDENPKKKVRAIFYTTTAVSELARRFAKELGIELQENFQMNNNYCCIKCNISQVNGEKIYHLPFDQQYDHTKIEIDKGELYCETVKEAEEKGFRRAFRWKGTKAD